VSRPLTRAILVASIVLVLAPVVAVTAGIAVGAWVPAGSSAPDDVGKVSTATLAPDEPDEAMTMTWPDLLAAVGEGRVHDVVHQDALLSVSGDDGFFEVRVGAGVADVLGALEAAAGAAGVPAPYYSKVPN
jgi:hypothetical protein